MVPTLIQSLRLLLVLTVLTGIIYPLTITVIAQMAFPSQANGSLVKDAKTGEIRGSSLLGQQFSQPQYLHSRASSTSPFPYNAAASGGSNLGPTNKKLIDDVKARIEKEKDQNATAGGVPLDLVTSSASGLDPHISIASARYQIDRIARSRSIDRAKVEEIISRYSTDRDIGVFGEPRVNVLLVNLALDGTIK